MLDVGGCWAVLSAFQVQASESAIALVIHPLASRPSELVCDRLHK